MLDAGPDQSRGDPEPAAAPRVLAVISHVLQRLVARGDPLAGGSTRLGAFCGARAPTISIPKYLERIYKYTSCSPSCFVVGFVYIDRLLHKHPESLVVSLNVHRLVVTCVMVAAKVLDDVHYNNAFYARVGGVSNAELNKLEMELLFLLDFGVGVSCRVFESYCLHLEKEMSLNGAGLVIEKTINSHSLDDVTEISVDDTNNSSPPHYDGLA